MRWLVVVWLMGWGLMQAQVAWADPQVPVMNPFSGDKRAIREGRSSYRNFCSNCHGGKADGRGERGQGANLRKFKKGFQKYVKIVKEGREVKGRIQNMPAWGKVLPEDEIFKIGAYLETLAKEGANWGEASRK
ncbi:MAG: hypothetical protein ETSY1_00870 [Candidatus Entotheonella factor]|uniref:Cytochrome c domain-containing protein n=1 Tax=Entotheonella factor TaxID=1429438 RepID=W4LYM9_ENTF1|nr:c-type cytochrome [Candidatus Entotheonella palauensis]ETX03204.1 MAG: hypothetical protein ETSY1_00870 [Candidatus Entotheonella factor]